MINYENTFNEDPYIDRGGIKEKLEKENKKHLFSYFHVEGPAGIGKTRLISEFLRGLKKDSLIYTHTSPPHGMTVEGFAYLTVRKLSEYCDLKKFLSTFSSDKQLEYKAVFKDMYNHSVLYLTVENLACDLLFYLSNTHKIIFVIEDLHWQDEKRDSFLNKILNKIQNEGMKKILVMTTSRDPNSYSDVYMGEYVKLDTLSKLECLELIKMNKVSSDLCKKQATELMKLSEGNPYFINEAVKWFDQPKKNDDEKGHIPKTFSDIFKNQLDGFNQAEEKIMLASAVVGYRVTREELMALLPELAPYIDLNLKSLVAGGHLLELENHRGTYEFYHIIKQESLYNLIKKQDREAWHYALYKHYRSQNIKQVTNKFELCGLHLYKAKAYQKAIPFLSYTARKSLKMAQPKKSVLFFEQSLLAFKKAGLLQNNSLFNLNIDYCYSLMMQGNQRAADDLFADIKFKFSGKIDKNPNKVIGIDIGLRWIGSNYNKEYVLNLIKTLPETPHFFSDRFRLFGMLSDMGCYLESIEYTELFLINSNLYDKHRGRTFAPKNLVCIVLLANNYAAMGNVEKYNEYMEQSLQILNEIPDNQQKIYGLTFAASAMQKLGKYKEAMPLIERAYILNMDLNVGVIHPHVCAYYAYNLFKCGDPIKSLLIFSECVSFFEKSGYTANRAFYQALMANVYHSLGMNSVAIELLLDAKKRSAKQNTPNHDAFIDYMFAKILCSDSSLEDQFGLQNFDSYIHRSLDVSDSLSMKTLTQKCEPLIQKYALHNPLN